MNTGISIKSSLLGSMAVAALALLTAAYTAADPPNDNAIAVKTSPSVVSFVAGGAKAPGRLKVRVDGPAGQTVFQATSDAGIVDWIPAGELADGKYRWDAWFVPQENPEVGRDTRRSRGPAEPEVQYESGTFRLRDGLLEDAEPPKGNDHSSSHSGKGNRVQGLAQQIAGKILESLVPPATAAATHNDSVDVIDDAGDSLTQVTLQSSGNAAAGICNDDGNLEFFVDGFCDDILGTQEMLLEEDTGFLGLGVNNPAVPLHIGDNVPRLRFEDTDGGTAWTISASSDEFRLQDNGGGSRPFIVDSGTDSDGAPINSLYIESPTGDIGLGTSTPQDTIHITDSSPGIIFEDTDIAGNFHQLILGSTLRTDTPNSLDAMVLDVDGNLGLDTVPFASLHVNRLDGSAQVLVEDSGGSSPLQMFKLVNNGFPAFNLTDGSQTDVRWTFRLSGTQGSDERFTITKLGTGDAEFKLFADGSADFRGEVTADGMLLTSSREAKTDFAPVDERTILGKVPALEVSQWRYKGDPAAERHIGPMAEDFRRVFGLGDGKHISVVDLAGISLAAIQGLKSSAESKIRRQNERIRLLEERNRMLTERLERVERHLESVHN